MAVGIYKNNADHLHHSFLGSTRQDSRSIFSRIPKNYYFAMDHLVSP